MYKDAHASVVWSSATVKGKDNLMKYRKPYSGLSNTQLQQTACSFFKKLTSKDTLKSTVNFRLGKDRDQTVFKMLCHSPSFSFT